MIDKHTFDTEYYTNGELWKSGNHKTKRHKACVDIHVFMVCKVLFNIIYSEYDNFEFELNQIKHTSRKLDICVGWFSVMSRGIVSYHKNTKIIDIDTNDSSRFSKQFLSYNKLKTFKLIDRKSNSKKLECIIPKGAYYYLNEYGEYVSDSIIPLEITEF